MVQMKYASWTPDEPEQEEPNDEPTTRKDGEESSGMYIVTSKFLNVTPFILLIPFCFRRRLNPLRQCSLDINGGRPQVSALICTHCICL